MSIDKSIQYEIQGGVKNYLGKQKEVKAPIKWKSSPDHPETELAYITKAEKDLLVKKDLHGSLKGGVNRGPSGIMSLNGFGSNDPNQNVSGSQISAAETGSAGSGMSAQDRDDFRSAAIAAGAGQRVNPGFFDDRNTVSKAELERAKKFAPDAFKATRGGGLGSFFTGGGFLGNIIRAIGQKFGLGKRFNTPYDRPQFAPGFAINPTQYQNDIYNEFLDEEDSTKRLTDMDLFFLKNNPDLQALYEKDKRASLLNNFGDTTVPSSSYDMAGVNTPFARQAPDQYVSQFLPDTDIYNQQTTKFQKRPERVETDIFFKPELKKDKGGILDLSIPGLTVNDKLVKSDVAPQFQDMIMQTGMNETQKKMIDSAANAYSRVNPGEKLNTTTQQEIFDSVKPFDTEAESGLFGTSFGAVEADPMTKKEYQDYLISQGYI